LLRASSSGSSGVQQAWLVPKPLPSTIALSPAPVAVTRCLAEKSSVFK
jgi:hypothetical protein